ncbi:hypothetical protein KIL84_016103 [Mauremys mutica]|uniref:Uncharacterized protein n=1 Tax=Mauremys mutica TaxID=74926 RepID=A0A9D3WTX2_9SAUR|nr:hypothetical protein KIL84_016103 [Mauremys mutica]
MRNHHSSWHAPKLSSPHHQATGMPYTMPLLDFVCKTGSWKPNSCRCSHSETTYECFWCKCLELVCVCVCTHARALILSVPECVHVHPSVLLLEPLVLSHLKWVYAKIQESLCYSFL